MKRKELSNEGELPRMSRRGFVSAFGASSFFSNLLFKAGSLIRNIRLGETPESRQSSPRRTLNPAWPRPAIVPLPETAVGASVLDLAGTWKLATAPPADFWTNEANTVG